MVPYHYALLRVVPHVHLGAFANVGVMMHSRTAEFLGLRLIRDLSSLPMLAGEIDGDLLQRYLGCYERICDGDESAGPLALLPRSERFHWMTAPRSDVLQPSPVHEGLTDDPATALERLFGQLVSPEGVRGGRI
jgi:hypothetical protein